jgi:hypothetical protein
MFKEEEEKAEEEKEANADDYILFLNDDLIYGRLC